MTPEEEARRLIDVRLEESSRVVQDLIKVNPMASLGIEPEDLDLSPFDRKGGLGQFYDMVGELYEAVLQEMNVEFVA